MTRLAEYSEETENNLKMSSSLFTTPVGRIVMGSLYKPNTTDAEGKPLVVKNGANIGQPRVQYFFAIAIPKNPGETHFSQTAWGAEIWKVGHTAFPQAAQSAAFAWKIEDGDSAVPNKKGRKPCDNDGWPSHWILKLSGGFAPTIYRQDGAAFTQMLEPDAVKPGYFVEVRAEVNGNGSQSQPGVYLNYKMVCFRAYGPEIVFGESATEAGFGQSALPAGASMVPAASSVPMPTAAPAAPAPVAAAPAPSPIPVTPNPAFLQVPGAAPGVPLPVPQAAASPAPPAIPAPAAPASPTPPAPPASPSRGPQMTALAAGASYASFVAGGWTDAQMIAQGYMVA
jgi:hypothetical protein